MFDPYKEWFKIPAGRLSPSYYELLDITPRDADDPVAVRNAAERRSDQLLRHTNGPNAADCVRIAAEVEQASNTLLDAELRREYDARLRQQTALSAANKAKPGPRNGAGPVAANPTAATDVDRSKPNRAWVLPVIGGVAVLLVLAGGTFGYFLSLPEKRNANTTANEPVVSAPVPLALPAVSLTVAPAREVEKKESPPETPTSVASLVVGPTLPPLPPEVKPAKLPVPDAVAQERAERTIKEAYSKDYERLRTPDDRLALAAKFLQPGRENRKDPAEWFVMLREARDLSVRAERPRLAVEAVTEIDKHFKIDPVEMSLTALMTIARPTAGEKTTLLNDAKARALASVALGRINVALKEDNYDAALRFVALAAEVATRLRGDKKSLAIIEEKRAEVVKARITFKAIAEAQDQLKAAPEDPAANLLVGLHLAGELGKWDEGLPHLLRGNDAALKDAAKIDLGRPADAKSQLALADFWWSQARQHGGRGESEVQQHAAYWYEKAAAELPNGADRDRAIDRVYDVGRSLQAGGYRLPPGTFPSKDLEDRTLLLREGGGTMQSEEAVERGLAWLVAHQAATGGWGTDTFAQAGRCTCPDPGRKAHDIAGTAFGLLPLLSSGNTHRFGKYSLSVAAGINYLMEKQQREGNFSYGAPYGPYENALATIVLCEAYAVAKESARDLYGAKLQSAATRAVNYLAKTQSPFGGWGYEPRSLSPDTSVTFWQLWAVRSAINAGIFVPQGTFEPVEQFLDRVAERGGPGYWYKPPGVDPKETGPRATLLPDGILCREFLGATPAEPHLARSARALARPQDLGSRDRMAIYYLFFAQQALHHFGGRDWEEWNPKARDMIISLQDKGTEFGLEHRRGSWSPVGEQWMDEGGRLMCTSLAILGLEVYYTMVPLNGSGPAALND